jgi:hypothetical protein
MKIQCISDYTFEKIDATLKTPFVKQVPLCGSVYAALWRISLCESCYAGLKKLAYKKG